MTSLLPPQKTGKASVRSGLALPEFFDGIKTQEI